MVDSVNKGNIIIINLGDIRGNGQCDYLIYRADSALDFIDEKLAQHIAATVIYDSWPEMVNETGQKDRIPTKHLNEFKVSLRKIP